MNDAQIESTLRRAPRPPTPPDLKQQLLSEVRLPNSQNATNERMDTVPFWRRWTPVLSFGVFFLGCLIVLGIQTSQLLNLRRENESLRAATSSLEQLREENAELDRVRSVGRESDRRRQDGEELQKLRAEVEELRGRAGEMSTLRAENRRLQAEHAAQSSQASVPPTDDPFAKMKEKASATQCINNLKQIGLAARIWANDHNTNGLPLDWLVMRKQLSTPKVLTCPADTARIPAVSWEQFDGSSVSYELPSATPDERDPYIVYSRCPVHGSVGLSDGSVQLKFDPAKLQRVDGNLRFKNNATIGTKP